jgi:hypothetical protein
MGDALGVAGTAVGIVSLGLQVCQGIIDYYSSWKDYNSDVADTYKLVDQLNSTFALLRDAFQLSKSGGSSLGLAAAEQAERCIGSCEGGIAALEKLLTKIKIKEPHGGRKKLEAQGMRFLYPFRQGTLGKLRDAVLEMRDSLNPVLHVLNMYVYRLLAPSLWSRDGEVSTDTGLETLKFRR